MTQKEIIKLLNRKIKEALETSKQDHGAHNNEAWSHYYNGVAEGLKEAKGIIGMLDKRNNRICLVKKMKN
jgi:hypothetical protein